VIICEGCGEGTGDAEPGLRGEPVQEPPGARPAQGGRRHRRGDQGGEGMLDTTIAVCCLTGLKSYP